MNNHPKNEGGNWGSSIFFIANLLNFVLATAVFTIPFPMHEVGIILGTTILAITCFISVVACTFIIEALALKNSLVKRENIILNKAIKINELDKKENDKENEEKDKDKDRLTLLSKESLSLSLEEKKGNDSNSNSNTNSNNIEDEKRSDEKKGLLEIENENILDEKNDSFYIAKRFEISKLSKALSKPGYFFVVITIICYLYVGVT